VVVRSNDVVFEEVGYQGSCGDGKYHRLIETDFAVIQMKTRQTSLNGVRLGTKFLVS
jgi:hypothetical protein